MRPANWSVCVATLLMISFVALIGAGAISGCAFVGGLLVRIVVHAFKVGFQLF